MPKRKAEVDAKRDEEEEEPEEKRADDDDQSGDGDGAEENPAKGSGDEDEEDEDEDDSDEDSGSEDSFPDASSSEAESEDDDDGEAYKEINVQFEFFDPQERDFHGLKALLNTYLDGEQYDCSGLVDAIIKQTAVGSVVKSAEDDDPFAVMSVFNTAAGRHKGDPWVGQVCDYILRRCPDKDVKAKLEKAFAGPGTGLLVSERLINCPPQLAPPLVQMLLEEVEGAATDEDYPKEEREEFAFQRYLHFTRVYTDPQEDGEEGDREAGEGTAAEAGPSGGPAGKKAGAKGKGKEPLIVYVRPEDEYLHQVCSWSFTFPIESRPVAKDDLKPLRAVMCIEAAKVAEARAMMDLVVGNMMADGGGAAAGPQAAAGAGGAAGGASARGGQDTAEEGGKGRKGQKEAAAAAGGSKAGGAGAREGSGAKEGKGAAKGGAGKGSKGAR